MEIPICMGKLDGNGMKRSGIYKITSPSGKVYIGQSWEIHKRWGAYRNNAAYRQPYLNASFKKHGVDKHNFEIVHELPDDCAQEIMTRYEQIYINAYRDCGFIMLNVREAGATGKHSIESRNKMKGKLGKWMIGRKLSKETIKKRTIKQRGLKRSEVSKTNLSKSKMGDKNPSKYLSKDVKMKAAVKSKRTKIENKINEYKNSGQKFLF